MKGLKKFWLVFASVFFLMPTLVPAVQAAEEEQEEQGIALQRDKWFHQSRQQGLNGQAAAAVRLKAHQQALAMPVASGPLMRNLSAPAGAAAPSVVFGNWAAKGPNPLNLFGTTVSGRGSCATLDLV